MEAERPIIHDEIGERLRPGFSILMAGPSTVAALGFASNPVDRSGIRFSIKGPYDHALAGRALKEHSAIRDLFVSLVGLDRLKVINTKIIGNTFTPNGKMSKDLGFLDPGYQTFAIPSLNRYYQTWLRDAHTVLDDEMLVNPAAWTEHTDFMVPSSLGEGGKVLVRGKKLLVAMDLWRNSKNDIRRLREQGYTVAPLPLVDQTKQAYRFRDGHIDGHANLIEDENGGLVLLVAESYSRQGGGTGKQIRSAASLIGAEVVEIDDSRLPPLALNFIQLEDGSTASTSTESGILEDTLSGIVGSDKVHTTSIPLEVIPREMEGSLRCMTNEIPF